jgi:dihydrofolate synthase/folylpolyglutamate synthase
VAIVEVGLGGRTDSTNVLQPVVAVITSISLDHTRQLGNTLSSIAAHKAGIIKPGVPVVSGVTEPEPRDVIERIAQENGCRCYRLQRDFRVSYGGSQVGSQVEGGIGTYATTGATFDYEEDCGPTPVSLRSLSIAMLGRHQTSNAAVALATLGRLGERGWRVTEAAIRCGLARVHMPARTEVVQQRPTVIVDVAHNVASVRALVEVIRETCPRTTTRRRILVFAASQDKDVATMLRILLPEFDVVVVTRFVNNPRAANPNALRAAAEQVLAAGEIRPCELLQEADAEAAWRRAHAIATPDDLICVAGSFFLASDVWSLLPRQRGATPDAAR